MKICFELQSSFEYTSMFSIWLYMVLCIKFSKSKRDTALRNRCIGDFDQLCYGNVLWTNVSCISSVFILEIKSELLEKISHHVHDSVGFILFEFLFVTGFRGYIFSSNENHYFRGIVVTWKCSIVLFDRPNIIGIRIRIDFLLLFYKLRSPITKAS